MVRALVAVRRPRDVDGAMIEQEPGALILRSLVERDVVLRIAPVTRADDARLNDERTAGPWAGVANVDGVEPLDEHCRSLSSGTTRYMVCETGSMTGVPTMPMLRAKSS